MTEEQRVHRSGCTYVQADLALHSLQNKTMVANRWTRDKTVIIQKNGSTTAKDIVSQQDPY